MANDSNRGSVKKPNRRKGALSVYSNLSGGRKSKADARSRQKAEFLATLPKSRLKRVAYRLNPRRLAKYWFSKEGGLMALKLAGLGLAAFIILILAVFAIFRKDLALGPDELTKRVQSRTTKFYDRTNQVLLYELYKDQQMTYVKSDQISNNMKYATIAIEDKDFYKHGGFDLRGIGRTVVNNVTGGGKQGASTITQQLVKNVILEDSTRTGLAGYTRKLKELILSIELERTYSKDEILNYYLNAIGYGGTAYGVESASKRYFAKNAKDLTIEESAYIAAIPQYPSIYDKNSPSFDQEATIARTRTVIDYMQQQGYINSTQASNAKKVDILAKIVPLNNNVDIKAPHFVNEIIKELEGEYGANNVRKGGWRITTTLDWDLQQIAEQSVKDNIRAVERYNGNNAAMVAIDVKTNQVLAMVGSRDYNHPGFGSFNAATSSLQPGSSLKPFVYSTLFEGNSYGPGSVIPDSPEKFFGISPNNFDKRFRGAISIRSSLAESRNLPAMKAANIAGMKNVIDRAKTAGETDITCGQAGECSDPFLAIGSGSVHLDQHTAAYASLARGGVSKPESNILKIEKAGGEVVKEWKDTTGTKVFGEKGQEISYLVSDILSDRAARTPTFGGNANQVGFNPNGVRIAVKTGTTDNAKDGWMMGYSPKLAVGVWVGRADGVAMGNNAVTHLQTGPMFGAFMEKAHKQVMTKPQYGWKSGDWFTQPRGIQRLTIGGKTDLFQSWFRKPRESNKTYTMDRVSKKLATACTPEGAKEQIQVTGTIDSTTNKEVEGTPPSGYDIKNNDDVHQCGDPQPSATVSAPVKNGNVYTVNATVSSGKFPIQTVDFLANGQILSSQPSNGGSNYTVTNVPPNTSIQVRVTDQGYYQQSSNTVTTGP